MPPHDRRFTRSVTVSSPRRRCKRRHGFPFSLTPGVSEESVVEEADAKRWTKPDQFWKETNREIRFALLDYRGGASDATIHGERLESNAHCDRNNLSVQSSGGRVVIARLKIQAVTGLAYLYSETYSSIPAQGS